MWSVLRAVGTVAVLVTVYYLLPLNHVAAIVVILPTGLILLTILVVFETRSIISSPYPAAHAIEAIAISIPLVLLLFASAYVSMSKLSSGSFGGPLTHTASLYFTVTVFSTVGFGDITAKTDGARLLVTGQMVVDIVIIGVVVKALSYAVKVRRGKGQTAADTTPHQR